MNVELIRLELDRILSALIVGAMEAVPRVVAALLLIVLAFVVAALMERLLRAVFERLRFDSLLRRVGVDLWLQRVGIRQSINELVPRIIYFLLLFLFARTAADAMGLRAISSAIGTLMAYLPNLIAALLIVLFGSVAAQFVGNAVAAWGRESGLAFARPLGNVVSGVLLFILAVMALAQLQVDTEIIRLFATALLAGGALAFGLSFGLGSRDATRNIIAGFYARRTLRIGEELEVRGERGVLAAITPTQLLLRQGERTITVANAVLLDEVTRQ